MHTTRCCEASENDGDALRDRMHFESPTRLRQEPLLERRNIRPITLFARTLSGFFVDGDHSLLLSGPLRLFPIDEEYPTGIHCQSVVASEYRCGTIRLSGMASRTPLITLVLVAANLLAFSAELAGGGYSVCAAYGLVPARFMASGEVAPIFSSLFLHDPSRLFHLGGNMAFLAIFGALVERGVGHIRFAALYVAAGVLGALLHVVVDPSATTPLVGASGAIFGVLAVAGVLQPRLLGFVLGFGALNIWHAFAGDAGDVSFGCHLGGLMAGALFAAVWRCGAEPHPCQVAQRKGTQ